MSTVQSADRLMTAVDAADYLGVQVQTLACWRHHKRYRLPYVRVGRSIRYWESDLKAFLDSRRVGENEAEE